MYDPREVKEVNWPWVSDNDWKHGYIIFVISNKNSIGNDKKKIDWLIDILFYTGSNSSINSFGAELPKIAYCYSPKQF